jgi:hypothetical protein
MNNFGYIVAAYVLTLGAVAAYGLLLWTRLRGVEQELSALTSDEGKRYGQR